MDLLQFPINRGCQLCELHTSVKTVCVPTIRITDSLPALAKNPAVIFLGQNPGQKEDVSGEPFVGPAGRLLRGAYVDGINLRKRAAVYLTNTARCFNKKPTNKQYRICFEEYAWPDINSIAALHPNTSLVCCGGPATSHFFKFALGKAVSLSNRAMSGTTVTFPSGRSIVVFTTFHPAYILRGQPQMIHAVADHLELLNNHLDGLLVPPSEPEIVPPRSPVSE